MKIGFIFESNTHLFRAESILKKQSIECTVVATPMKYSPKGCTLSILVDEVFDDLCEKIFAENGIVTAGKWVAENE